MSDLPTPRDLAPLLGFVVALLVGRLVLAWLRRAELAGSVEAVARARRWGQQRGLSDRGGEDCASFYGGTFARLVRESSEAEVSVTLRRQSGRFDPPSVVVGVAPRRALGGGVIIRHAGAPEIAATPSGDARFDAVCAVYVHDARSARGLDAEGRQRVADFFARARELRLQRVQLCSGEMGAAYGFGSGASAYWVGLDVPEALLDAAVAACAALAMVSLDAPPARGAPG